MEGTTRIVFSGGGTGGHVYPALAVAEELKRRHTQAIIVFIGSRRGLERRVVPQHGYELRTFGLTGIKGASVAGKALAAVSAGWAVMCCVAWMVRERPNLDIGVGGYASGPAVLAARFLRVPTMIMEQNHFPGATNRWLAPRVDAVCLPSEAARSRIGGKRFVTGNPVRREFFEASDVPGTREPGLLIFGGSRGARSINIATCEALGELSRIRPQLHIAHQTGRQIDDPVWYPE